MKTKNEALYFINNEMEEISDINPSIAQIGVVSWRGEPTSLQWKKIGYIGALSWAYGITQTQLNKMEEKQ